MHDTLSKWRSQQIDKHFKNRHRRHRSPEESIAQAQLEQSHRKAFSSKCAKWASLEFCTLSPLDFWHFSDESDPNFECDAEYDAQPQPRTLDMFLSSSQRIALCNDEDVLLQAAIFLSLQEEQTYSSKPRAPHPSRSPFKRKRGLSSQSYWKDLQDNRAYLAYRRKKNAKRIKTDRKMRRRIAEYDPSLSVDDWWAEIDGEIDYFNQLLLNRRVDFYEDMRVEVDVHHSMFQIEDHRILLPTQAKGERCVGVVKNVEMSRVEKRNEDGTYGTHLEIDRVDVSIQFPMRIYNLFRTYLGTIPIGQMHRGDVEYVIRPSHVGANQYPSWVSIGAHVYIRKFPRHTYPRTIPNPLLKWGQIVQYNDNEFINLYLFDSPVGCRPIDGTWIDECKVMTFYFWEETVDSCLLNLSSFRRPHAVLNKEHFIAILDVTPVPVDVALVLWDFFPRYEGVIHHLVHPERLNTRQCHAHQFTIRFETTSSFCVKQILLQLSIRPDSLLFEPDTSKKTMPRISQDREFRQLVKQSQRRPRLKVQWKRARRYRPSTYWCPIKNCCHHLSHDVILPEIKTFHSTFGVPDARDDRVWLFNLHGQDVRTSAERQHTPMNLHTIEFTIRNGWHFFPDEQCCARACRIGTSFDARNTPVKNVRIDKPWFPPVSFVTD